ncbi:MAG: metallopeptidase family protein, partial [Planctomycetota bacterium JB042]
CSSDLERLAIDVFDRIPEEFREDIDGLVLEQEARHHPAIEDYFTLGECVHRTALIAEAPLLSTIVLYYGSFVAVAERDPSFDVPFEVEETILHELRHHFEDRAGVLDLADEDAIEEMNERRRKGLPFDPTFHRFGEEIEPGVTEVGRDLFIEASVSARPGADLPRALTVRLGEETFDVPIPPLEDDITFVEVDGGWEDDSGAGGDLFLVVVRRRRGLGR